MKNDPQYNPLPNIHGDFNKVMYVMDNFEDVLGVLREQQEFLDKEKEMVVEESVEMKLEERPSHQPPK